MLKTKTLLVSTAMLALLPFATFAHDGSNGNHGNAHFKMHGRFGQGIVRGVHAMKNALVGTVTSVTSSGSFTVQKLDGTSTTMTTDSSTKVDNHGTVASSSAITVNSKVIAKGKWNDPKTILTAAKVKIVDNLVNPVHDFWKNLFSAHAVVGTITAVNGNVITITTKDNAVFTADLTGAKLVKKNSSNNAAISDFKVNDKAEVLGNVSGSVVTVQVAHDLTN